MLPMVPKKQEQIVEKASFFVVEILSILTVFGTAVSRRGGVGTRLVNNHNIGKITGTRVDMGLAPAQTPHALAQSLY